MAESTTTTESVYLPPSRKQILKRLATMAVIDQIHYAMTYRCVDYDQFAFKYAMEMDLLSPELLTVARRFLVDHEGRSPGDVDVHLDRMRKLALNEDEDD